jgi:hypothetical protein
VIPHGNIAPADVPKGLRVVAVKTVSDALDAVQ